jgi:hypothetical protein
MLVQGLDVERPVNFMRGSERVVPRLGCRNLTNASLPLKPLVAAVAWHRWILSLRKRAIVRGLAASLSPAPLIV